MLVAPESSPGAPWGTLGSKNIRTSEAAPVKRGDRQPEQQTLVVPQRQCLWLVVYLPVQWPLPPTRGTTACPCIVAHITKTDACSWCGRILVFYSPYCLEWEFSEVALLILRFLRSSPVLLCVSLVYQSLCCLGP